MSESELEHTIKEKKRELNHLLINKGIHAERIKELKKEISELEYQL